MIYDGAQGRDRTTDTAIFSRMLYQLSYLGILRAPERRAERAVYSGVGPLCPPSFAFGFAGRGPPSEAGYAGRGRFPKLLANNSYSASSGSVSLPGMT